MAEETTQTSGSSNTKVYKILCYLSYLWLIPYFVAKGEVRDENMVLNLKQGFGCLFIIVIGQISEALLFEKTVDPLRLARAFDVPDARGVPEAEPLLLRIRVVGAHCREPVSRSVSAEIELVYGRF